MAVYEVKLAKSVRKKDLKKLTKVELKRLVSLLGKISADPYLKGSVKLVGKEQRRARFGSHRVIYEVYDDELVVIALKVSHRKDVYR